MAIPLNLKKAIFLLLLASCLTPFVDPPIALLLGIIVAQTIGHPFIEMNSKATKILLQSSVVGLGFGMNLFKAMKAGQEGLYFTIGTIASVLIAGYFIGRWLKIEKKTSYLLSSGTAICGGSAIAAVSPLINASDKEISVSLGIVFILNSIALFIFPALGHYLNMTQHQFGVWAAVAIHDTSSVVGAASKFGKEALETATTIKLERALWIIPLAIFTTFVFKSQGKKIKIPWFILYFILAMCLSTYLIHLKPVLKDYFDYIVLFAKKGLTITLFLIGAGLSKSSIRAVGIKPFLLGIILWVIISVSSLYIILHTVNS